MLLKNSSLQRGKDDGWRCGGGTATTRASSSVSPRPEIQNAGGLQRLLLSFLNGSTPVIKCRLVLVDEEVRGVYASKLVGVFGPDGISELSDNSAWRMRDIISRGDLVGLPSLRVQEEEPNKW